MFRRLDPARIVETARRVHQRVTERFPEAGLARVAAEVVEVIERAAADRAWFGSPHWPLRIGVSAGILLLLAAFSAAVLAIAQLHWATDNMPDVVQAVDSFISEVVFLGIAIVFLSSLEVRLKRLRALKALHELRSLAHVIDMHQLNKDPDRILNPAAADTASSPVRTMNAFELSRYLDYCSEMLSLLSKCAAIYAQDFEDPITISSVNEIESLTSGLSRKIWQKITVLGARP